MTKYYINIYKNTYKQEGDGKYPDYNLVLINAETKEKVLFNEKYEKTGLYIKNNDNGSSYIGGSIDLDLKEKK
jgi:hypothetical protein